MNENPKIMKNWRNVIQLAFLFLFILMAQDFLNEVVILNYNTSNLEEALEDQLKITVKEDVEHHVGEVETNISQIYEDLYLHIKQDFTALEHSVNEVNDLLSYSALTVRQSTIKGLVQRFNQHDDNHCFYILSPLGESIYDCQLDTFDNGNYYQNQDVYGRYYIQDIVFNGLTKNSDIVQYYLETDEAVYRYLSLSTYDDETGYIIGMFVWYENYNNNVKNDFVYNFNNHAEHENSDTFIIDGNKTILHAPDSYYTNKNIEDISPSSDYYYYNEYYNYAIKNVSGFVTKVHTNDVKIITYLHYIEEWNIIVGSSRDMEQYETIVSNFQTANYNFKILLKIPVYLVLINILVVIYRGIKENMLLSEMLFKEEEDLYRKFADYSLETIVITNKSGKILFVNKRGTDYLFHDIPNIMDTYLTEVLVEEDGYYSIYTRHDRFHVKYNIEEVSFEGSDADLYIIHDVTDKIINERKLQALTLEDELTNLGNRRLLVKDFNDTVSDHIKAGKEAFLVMLDLDNFKLANDKYGHHFGDKVLEIISKIFIENLPKDSNIYRIGGDEFAILSRNCTLQELIQALQTINQILIQFEFEKPIDISFSAGIVKMNVNDKKRRLSDYYEQADDLLYMAKEEGKSNIKV